MRVDAYSPELPADRTDVRMTAFMTAAAAATPACLKTRVKGEIATSVTSSPSRLLFL